MEMFQEYENGFDWKLSFEDILELAENTSNFVATSLEGELLDKYFKIGEDTLTSTEIKIHIEKFSGQKIYLDKLCKELKRKGFVQQRKMVNGSYRRCYLVDETRQKDVDMKF